MAIFPSLVILLLFSIIVAGLVHSKIEMAKVPQLVSWAGLRDEALSKTRACIRELTAELRTLTLGYEMVREQLSAYPTLLMVSFDSLAKMVCLV